MIYTYVFDYDYITLAPDPGGGGGLLPTVRREMGVEMKSNIKHQTSNKRRKNEMK